MNDDNHKTLQEFAMGEIIKELRAERDALKAEIEAAKENHRLHSARLISEKIVVSEQLGAARKQEPAVLIEGKKIFWNPEHKGVHEGGFYASPVPAQQGTDMQCTCGHKWIAFDPQENCPRCNPEQQLPDDARYAVDPIYDEGDYYITGADINAILKGGENER